MILCSACELPARLDRCAVSLAHYIRRQRYRLPMWPLDFNEDFHSPAAFRSRILLDCTVWRIKKLRIGFLVENSYPNIGPFRLIRESTHPRHRTHPLQSCGRGSQNARRPLLRNLNRLQRWQPAVLAARARPAQAHHLSRRNSNKARQLACAGDQCREPDYHDERDQDIRRQAQSRDQASANIQCCRSLDQRRIWPRDLCE